MLIAACYPMLFARLTVQVMSPDNKFVYTAGVYKPRIRCYELDQLSMKFERHLDAEVVAMQCLSQDYSKVAMLLADRSLEIHARYDIRRCAPWTETRGDGETGRRGDGGRGYHG